MSEDVTTVAAELNKREAERALRGPIGVEGFFEGQRPSSSSSSSSSWREQQQHQQQQQPDDVAESSPQRWYIAVHNDIDGQSALTFSIDVEVSARAECPSPDCSGHGTCDTTVGACVCDEGYLGRSCAARVIPLEPTTNASSSSWSLHDEVLAVGEFTFFRFSVNCTGQDMELLLTKKTSSSSAAAAGTETADTAAAAPAAASTAADEDDADATADETATPGSTGTSTSTGSEVELAIQFGALPTLDDGGFLDGVVSMQDEPDTWIDLSNAAPGVYYAVVHVSAGDPLPGFDLRLALEGSRVPNTYNGGGGYKLISFDPPWLERRIVPIYQKKQTFYLGSIHTTG